MTVCEKLTKIREELRAIKSQNDKMYFWTYEDILSEVKPLLEKYKVALIFTNDCAVKSSEWYSIGVTATLLDAGDTEEKVSVRSYACLAVADPIVDMTEIKDYSFACAKRGVLNDLFHIDYRSLHEKPDSEQNAAVAGKADK